MRNEIRISYIHISSECRSGKMFLPLQMRNEIRISYIHISSECRSGKMFLPPHHLDRMREKPIFPL
jgi:hypothetical protein